MIDSISRDEAEQLFKEYSPFVFRMALLLTRTRTLADDVVQETFLRVFQKYHLFDRSKPIQPWICMVTVNVARNMLRKHRWQVLTNLFPAAVTDSSEEILMQNEEQRHLWNRVQKLPQKSREVVILRYYADLSLNEISVALDIPVGTCKSRLNTAVNLLRKGTSYASFQQICEGGEVK